ncbi:MAG: choice-of-anchor P family protein [Terriglobales bacterium]
MPRKERSSTLLAHLLWAMLILIATSAPVWAQDQTLLFKAGGYGTYAFVGKTVELGKTAAVSVGGGCGTPEENASKEKTVLTVNGAPLAATGVINTSATTSATAATGTSDVHQVNLLAGAITADEVMAVSTTSDTGGTLGSSAAGSNFVNLVVLGIPITGTPAPNTTIALPLFGYVVLNEQIPLSKKEKAGLTVNMIHVYINTKNALGIPLNTQIIVADAHSGLAEVSGPGVLDGTAFGTKVNVAHLVTSSATAPASVGCMGNDGKVKTNSVASVNLSPLATSGTITDTAEGDVTPSLAQSQTTSTVEALNILSATVTADVILASAGASTSDGTTFTFSDGSAFTNLAVAGHPEIGANPPPNTQVDLAGLGTLWLHRVIQKRNSIEIRMVELEVNQANVFGIAIGTDIKVADAEASLHSNAKP